MVTDRYQSLIDDALALQRQGEDQLPPADGWNPPLSGDMPLRISRDGRWWHQGSPIQRHALVCLFASILKKEGSDYFLVTPVEKWRIDVEDVPLLIVAVKVLAAGTGKQVLVFESNVGDQVMASDDNPLRVVVDADSGEPSPYLLVRHNLEGRLTRTVFYELAALAKPSPEVGDKCHGVFSCGTFFPLE